MHGGKNRITTAEAEGLLLQGVRAAESGRLSMAAQLWWQLIGAEPAPGILAQAWFNLGLLCRKSRDEAAAEDCLRNAVAADAENFEAREQLAALIAAAGRNAEAAALFAQLAADDPSPRHYFNHALLLSKLGRRVEAEAAYRAGLTLDPDDAATLRNLGLLLAESASGTTVGAGSTTVAAEALDCLRRAAVSAPADAAIQANLGVLFEADSQLDLAAACLQRALELAPDSPVSHCDLGVLYAELGRMQEAEACFQRAEALDPGYERARFCRAHLLLASGRYAEGWRLHERRFQRAAAAGKPLLEPLSVPQWQGEPLAGKRILLRQEQGYGDEIQFARYYPLLKARGAARVELVCKPALAPLLQAQAPSHSGLDAVVGSERRDLLIGDPPPDYWTSAMSLPLWLALPEPLAQLPYLQAPAADAARWAAQFAAEPPGLRVGLLWQGNPLHSNDAHRSLPGIETLAPLWQVPGVHFYSLQREAVDTALPLRQFVAAEGPRIDDFAAAAGLIAQLDLVISVDSAYAHLAGALGKPVWLLLPARNTDWRWLRERDDSPWYPGTLRLFRQRRRQDWRPVVAALAAALRERVAAPLRPASF